MKLIKVTGNTNPDQDVAEDALAGTAAVPGFIFGYIEPNGLRVISFFQDANPNEPTVRGTTRVTGKAGVVQ